MLICVSFVNWIVFGFVFDWFFPQHFGVIQKCLQVYIEDEAGFRIESSWKYNSPEPVFDGIMAKVVGLGSCVENVEMIILFDNGEKITKTSWNKFNCEGNAWYNLIESERTLFKTIPISKIRFTNSRTYDSITGTLEVPDYFITINRRAKNSEFDVINQ